MAQVYNSQLVSKYLPGSLLVANIQQDAFDLYHQIHEVHDAKHVIGSPALPALGHATAGSIGAAMYNVVTYPLALIVTRLQIQRSLRKRDSGSGDEGYRSLRDAASKIYEYEGGFAGFYAGIGSDTAKTIADSFLFFLAYNFLRQTRLRARGGSTRYLPVADELSVGFLAGAFSKLLTTPLANIVTRQQAAAMLFKNKPPGSRRPSLGAAASQIRSEKGLLGFWSGYSASLVLTLNPSLTFFLFETLKRLFVPRDKRVDPAPQVIFFLAAVSKAIASTITYPFSLAKSRAQISSKSVEEEERQEKGSAEKAHKETAAGAGKAEVTGTAPLNIFSALLQISRTEGLSALYEGLDGEVLKGFFSHGFTMIVKQFVHKLIIQLYYATLKLVRQLPRADAMIGDAKAKTKQTIAAVQDDLQPAVSSASKNFQSASSALIDSGRSTLDSAQHEASLAAGAAKQATQVISENTLDFMRSTKEDLKSIKREDG
ncbi:MAG: hypothetical protein L6R40_000147 [Gallowayella cf. fulva]|nr:MAG: hypothetical protein L6R40_000147 [Xanthomendoza cf. fulva]